ncbi:MAG: ribosomal RNA small subunit methyltransferase A [Candidatus Omnitrophica bacterium CG1_02_40_15]|nr:MAG: ribosomal RNA small subunit methyltransferase A [Candidatus Omnitrophica bacterium CG1_02_40_15]
MLKLSEVKAILREYNIRPSKRFGQNFLIDQNIKNKIIGSMQLKKEDIALEIGPGLGALTEDLSKKARMLIAVEKDKRLYDYLRGVIARGAFKCSNRSGRGRNVRGSAESSGRGQSHLELINDDILKYLKSVGIEQCSVPTKLIIVGNLPYSISSPILKKLIDNRSSIKSLYATVQAEFGERIVALPGTKDYGSLSCYAQFYGEPKILFKIPKGAFFPVPEVDSCFLKIGFEKQLDSSIDQSLLFKIIRSSFEKRRKTILNSMASSGIFKSKQDALLRLTKAQISPTRRPETISLQEFIKLSATSRDSTPCCPCAAIKSR